MERKKVYEIIDSEREYQNWRWDSGKRKDGIVDADKSVADWILYLEYHLNLAKDHIYTLRKNDALEEIRKITALGVACMEENLTKPRDNNYK